MKHLLLRLAFVLGIVPGVFGAETAVDDPNLLFRVDFDSYFVTADQAGGKKESTNFKPDLQLRMFPGINGKGNALKLNDREFCVYAMPGNFQTQQGTVSLWVSAQNWKFSEPQTHVFFEAKQSDFRLILYKYKELPYLCVYLENGDERNAVHAKVEFAEWESKQWHMITAVWDKDALRLYVDGRIPESYAPGDVHPAFPTRKFDKSLKIPPVSEAGVIGFGKLFGGFPSDSDAETGVDELRIYDRCLGAPEVAALYAEHITPVSAEDAPMVVTVPKTATAITLDGKLDADEWSDGVRLPLKKVFKAANHLLPSQTWVTLKYDAGNLYLGFVTDRKSTRHSHTEHDSEIYNDDSLDFFLKDRSGRDLWFCVNANGTLLDKRDNDLVFDSGAVARGRLNDDGTWSAEVKIPLAVLDNPAAGETFKANFHALDFASMPNYYLSWNSSPESDKAGPGSLRFGRPGEGLSIERLENLYKGHGNLSIRSAEPFTVTFLSNNVTAQTFAGSASDRDYEFSLPPGTQLLRVEQTNAQGETVYRYGLDFLVLRPLSVNVTGLPSKGLLQIKADLNTAGAKVLRAVANQAVTGHVALTRDGEVYSETGFRPETVSRVDLPLPPGLAPGTYQVEVTAAGDDFTLTESVPFRIPEQEPYEKHVALDHSIPDPWTALENPAPGVFQLLDREYDFNGTPFPAKMISRGVDVLATPFVLNFNGNPVTWEDFQMTERFPDYAVLTGSGTADGGYTVAWRGELWFDGLYKLDFTLVPPENGSRTIDSMRLDWSVPNRCARYFMQRNKEFVTIPWKDDAIATPLDITDASWLTGLEQGMLWLPLSTANWVTNGKNAFFLKRGAADTTVALDLIGKPSEPNGNVAYSFAFMATPARRPPENFRTLNAGSYLDNPYQNLQISSTVSDQQTLRADDVLGYAGIRMRDPEAFRTEWVEPYIRHGVRIFPYHQPMALSQYDPEFDLYLTEWRNTPGFIQANLKKGADNFDSIHCCGQGIADLHAYRLEKLFRDFPELGGIYYDICDVRTCDNTLHGHGGTDAFGQEYVDSTAMSLRHYLMRIYKVAHHAGKQVYNHAHNYFNPVAHNFTDIWYPGENEVWLYGENPDFYYSEAPLDEYQCAWNPFVRGTAIIRCNQVTRVLSFMDKLQSRRAEMETPEFAERSFVSAWLHDFNIDSDWINHRAVEHFWQVRDELHLNQARFYGYWFDDAVTSASPGVFCSRYHWETPSPYSDVLIVGNLSRENHPVALTIDRQALGLAGKKFEMTELWSDKPFTEKDLTDAIVPENHFLLIGIKPR